MATQARIRDAGPEELGEVARSNLEAYGEYEGVLAPEEWARMRWGLAQVEGWAGRCEVIVADLAGELAGSVAYFPPGTSLVGHFPPEWASIRLLAVHPAHRGRSVGRRLTEECIRRAVLAGAPRIGLHTGEQMAAARALYAKMGFEPYRELPPMFGFPYRAYSLKLTPVR